MRLPREMAKALSDVVASRLMPPIGSELFPKSADRTALAATDLKKISFSFPCSCD